MKHKPGDLLLKTPYFSVGEISQDNVLMSA
ncbi:hypothetical protein AS52_03051 [Priestia megaterium Q3]|uniref:Uncharacterized protein n=1 Tax=Priestia megaterium Q3 TaxID=1452722 RepID=A0A806TIM1_PRIMG|nr:hypothetical protein AS52_03051 [Priestia megaterium Q3]SDD40777.1 hypothetical protein SAMN04487777_103648 [Priestia aryabhattai B8W22]